MILDLADFESEATQASRGIAASLTKGGFQWQVGFAAGRDGILSERLNVDGSYFAGRWDSGRLQMYMAGAATSVWLDGALEFVADRPLDVAVQHSDARIKLKIVAAESAWIRVASHKPASAALDGAACKIHSDDATGMA